MAVPAVVDPQVMARVHLDELGSAGGQVDLKGLNNPVVPGPRERQGGDEAAPSPGGSA